MPRLKALLLPFLIASAFTPTLGAQARSDETSVQAPIAISCPADFTTSGDTCQADYQSRDGQQVRQVRVRVVSARNTSVGVPGAVVRFRATSGTLLPDSTSSDASGFAWTLWTRPQGRDTATVVVQARSGANSTMSLVRVGPPAPTVQLGMDVWRVSRGWFEKNPLPQPAVIHIYQLREGNPTPQPVDSATCAAQRVAFARVPGTGSVAPDTSTATEYLIANSLFQNLQPDSLRQQARGCFAVTNWTLGEGAGDRSLRATLIPSAAARVVRGQGTEIRTISRSLPRLVGGAAVAWRRSYVGVSQKDRVVRIERTLPDGSTMAFDTTLKGTATVDSISGDPQPAAFVGVSSALVPSWRRISATVGVDLRNPAHDWYGGISFLRLARGLSTEGLPIDLHLLAHVGRSQVLRDPLACQQGVSCETSDRIRFHGLGGMLSVDASSLFSELIKKIAG